MSTGSSGSFPEEVSGERSEAGSRGWAGPGGGWKGVLGKVMGWEKTGLQSPVSPSSLTLPGPPPQPGVLGPLFVDSGIQRTSQA